MNFPDSDDLDALFTATGPAASPAGRTPPASYKPAFTEKCAKCNGTGKFITPRGHVFGKCFACDGAGSKTFATSRGTRVKAKAQREARQDAERVENATAFKDENPNEWAWMLATAPRWQLIQSFLEAITKWGSLTDRQLEVVRNGMLRDADRAAAKVTAAPAVEAAGVDRLKAAFDTAAAYTAAKAKGLKVKSPRITLNGVTIKPAKAHSRNPGGLYAYDPEGDYLGKIVDGRFFAVATCTDKQKADVVAFVSNPDPAQAAKVYGQETGICCVCNATLRSEWRLRGIGPICAEKFGW
jgi:hypothetical protein